MSQTGKSLTCIFDQHRGKTYWTRGKTGTITNLTKCVFFLGSLWLFPHQGDLSPGRQTVSSSGESLVNREIPLFCQPSTPDSRNNSLGVDGAHPRLGNSPVDGGSGGDSWRFKLPPRLSLPCWIWLLQERIALSDPPPTTSPPVCNGTV